MPQIENGLIAKSPQLAQGMSLQPENLRQQGQLADAKNVRLSVVNGAERREGSEYARVISSGLDSGGNYRTFRIIRDSSEKYNGIFGRAGGVGIIRLFRIAGAESTVTISAASQTYLNLNSATADQLKIVPIEDYWLVINTTVVVSTTTGPTYSLGGTFTTYSRMVSVTPADDTYWRTTTDDGSHLAGYYKYHVNGVTFSTRRFLTVTGGSDASPNGIYDNTAGQPYKFRIGFQRRSLAVTGASWDGVNTITKTGAFTEVRTGEFVYLASGTGVAGAEVTWYEVVSRTDNTVTIGSGIDTTTGDVSVALAAAATADFALTGIGAYYEPSMNAVASPTSMYDVAAAIQTAFTLVGAADTLVSWTETGYQAGYFTITSPYRGSGATFFGPYASSAGGTNLQARAFNGTGGVLTAGTGAVTGGDPDFLAVDSRWTTAVASGQADAALDATKLPVVLTRTSAGNFAVDQPTWDSRDSGDPTSNPSPALFRSSVTINDAAFHRGRLVFAGGSKVAFSAAGTGATRRFYKDDATNTVDSDPIDAPIGGGSEEGQANIKHLISDRHILVAFSDGGRQHELSNPESLTPSTAGWTPTTAYKITTVPPKIMASKVFFLTPRQNDTGCFEYTFDETTATSTAADITVEVNGLIPSDPRSMAASTNENMLVVLPKDTAASAKLFVYKAFWTGAGFQVRKVQSAWCYWEFDGGYRICDISVIESDLWMLVESTGLFTSAAGNPNTTITQASHGYSNGDTVVIPSASIAGLVGSFIVANSATNTFTIALVTTAAGYGRTSRGEYTLERLSLTPEAAVSGWAFAIHLDRRMTLTGVFAAGVTTWTIPIQAKGSTLNKIVLGPAFGANSGVVVDIVSYTGLTVTATGDYSAGTATLGRYYDFKLGLTRPFVRDQQGNPDLDASVIAKFIVVSHQDSSDFLVRIDYDDGLRADRTSTHSPATIPTRAFKAWCMGDVEHQAVSVESSGVKPLTISAYQWDAEQAEAVR